MSLISNIKKKIPKSLKNKIKKMLGMRTEPRTTKVIMGEQFLEEASLLRKNFKRELPKIVSTKIKKKSAFPVVSKAIDKYIDGIIENKKYTFDKVLAILDPYGMSPLSAYIIFYTEKPYSVKFKIVGDTEDDTIYGELKEPTNNHKIPVFGLYPNRKNYVVVDLVDNNGKIVDTRRVGITTNDLPEIMKDAVRVIKYSKPSAFPFIQVSGKSTPFPFAFDSSGVVRYYLNFRPRGYGVFPLANGHFIIIDRKVLIPTYEIPHSTQIYEMDHFGRVYKQYFIEKGCHHDVFEMTPNGNLLFVSNSLNGHQEDMITEIDRNTGKVIKSLDLYEIYGDLYRDMINWVHINTVSYDPLDNTVFISPRNLHSAVKINWATNEVLWIVGDPRFWEGTKFYDKVLKPETGNIEDVKWFYQAHAVYELKEDLDGNPDTKHIILFDNHWHKRRRVEYFDDDKKSYAKIFTINLKKKTVRLEHMYGGVKSKITSNALLDIKNRRVFSMGAYLDPLIDDRGGMIYEFDYDTEEMLNQYSIKYYYYRAYKFEPNYEMLSKSMDLPENYIVGELKKAVKVEKPKDLSKCELLPKSKVKIEIIENTLYVEAKDHLIKQIYLVGKEYTFLRDLTDTEQTQDYFKEMVYAIAVPLEYLENDEYTLYINFEGVLYRTNKTIEIDG